jgi:hypothetical protein
MLPAVIFFGRVSILRLPFGLLIVPSGSSVSRGTRQNRQNRWYRRYHGRPRFLNPLRQKEFEETEEPKGTKKIPLKDIENFLVSKGIFANRIKSIEEQLQCIGGSAKDNTDLHPNQILTHKVGINPSGKIIWSHVIPDLNKSKVKISNIQVSFEKVGETDGTEGLDILVRPESQVVLYHLDYTKKGFIFVDNEKEGLFMIILYVSIILFVLYLTRGGDVTEGHKIKESRDTPKGPLRDTKLEKYRDTPKGPPRDTKLEKHRTSNRVIEHRDTPKGPPKDKAGPVLVFSEGTKID